MSVFSKNIAVIKTLRQGFSANGENLSGLIKCEKYATRLKVEVSYINFAPLSEGRLVCAVSDGKHTVLVENGFFEGDSEVETANGFCAMICFVHKGVLPIAAAVCGNYSKNLAYLPNVIAEKEKIIKAKKENAQKADAEKDFKNKAYSAAESIIKKIEEKQPYDDEAIAEDDYFEYGKAFKERGAFEQGQKKEENGNKSNKDEADDSTFKTGESAKRKGFVIGSAERSKNDKNNGQNDASSGDILGGTPAFTTGKSFYEEVKDEVERVLSSFPKEENLCNVVQNSKWVKINYGDNKFYVFGVIYLGNNPEYLCYGVPTKNAKSPPQSLKGLATFIPAERDKITQVGYWVTYQSAQTGASIKITQA